MTETTDLSTGTEETTTSDPRNAGLSALKLAQLQALASQLGITGARRMRKSLLVDAIAARFPSARRVRGDRYASVAKGLGIHARALFGT